VTAISLGTTPRRGRAARGETTHVITIVIAVEGVLSAVIAR
jgi:hypothetical protein